MQIYSIKSDVTLLLVIMEDVHLDSNLHKNLEAAVVALQFLSQMLLFCFFFSPSGEIQIISA